MFKEVQICQYSSPNIQHPIPYPYPNTLNYIFMMSTSNPILSDMVNIIRIRIRIRPEISVSNPFSSLLTDDRLFLPNYWEYTLYLVGFYFLPNQNYDNPKLFIHQLVDWRKIDAPMFMTKVLLNLFFGVCTS